MDENWCEFGFEDDFENVVDLEKVLGRELFYKNGNEV